MGGHEDGILSITRLKKRRFEWDSELYWRVMHDTTGL